jgi:hypothetical protein
MKTKILISLAAVLTFGFILAQAYGFIPEEIGGPAAHKKLDEVIGYYPDDTQFNNDVVILKDRHSGRFYKKVFPLSIHVLTDETVTPHVEWDENSLYVWNVIVYFPANFDNQIDIKMR